MQAIHPSHTYTEAEYLALECASGIRHEYRRGVIYAMAGASEEHNFVVINSIAHLHRQLRKTSCRVFSNDMRVKIPATQSYTYPDIIIVCGNRQYADDAFLDTLLNPRVIFEALSPSTQEYDRGEKFEMYKMLPSLNDYLIMAEDTVYVQHWTRQTDNTWNATEYTQLDQMIPLTSVHCQLRLADIYKDVEV